MKYSPEERRILMLQIALAAAGTVICFFINIPTGFIVASVSAGLIILQGIHRRKHIRRILSLCDKIDDILIGAGSLQFEEFQEGAVSILTSEIKKMTVCLMEQNNALRKDKVFLKEALEDMSHQLRTPLTTMLVITGMLRKPELTPAQRMKYLQELSDCLSHMQWLLETLLQMSRLDAGTVTFRKERLSAAELIREAVEPLSISMELKNIALNVDIQSPAEFTGDKRFCTEAVINLLKNCMEHTPEEGSITIAAAGNGMYTWIRITDSGEGIAQEELPHVFERFYRSDTFSKKGYGIGLAFSQKIISAQGGSILVRSALPHGAEFEIRFYE